MSTWINFAELRARISLEDVITRYYKIENMKRDGTKLVGPCPVHGGDSPRAFHADLDKNVWHCFSKCQKGGNQLDFVALRDNVGIREAALRLQAFFLGNGEKPTAPSQRATPASTRSSSPAKAPHAAAPIAPPTNPPPPEKEDDSNPVLDVKLALKGDHPHLVEDRRLKPETIAAFGVGYCGRGMLRGMIAIPIHDEDGDLVAYAGRRLKPSDIREFGKYRLPKGFKKERVLFNYHRAKALAPVEGLIVVEGFFGALKITEMGFANVVATMGVELSDYQAALLARAREVIVLYDGDEAGRTGAEHMRERLAPHTCVRVAHLPDGMKPDALPIKAVRWIVNGMKALNLAELRFAFQGETPPTSTDTPPT